MKSDNSSDLPVRIITPHNGIEEKAKITVRFLKQRMRDYEQIKREIAELEREIRDNGQRESTELRTGEED